MAVTLALFAAGIAMGLAGALMWAWGVHSGQFRNLENVKQQLFWPEVALDNADRDGAAPPAGRGAVEET